MTILPSKHDSFKKYIPLLIALVVSCAESHDVSFPDKVIVETPPPEIPPLPEGDPLPVEFFVVGETTITEFKKNRDWGMAGSAHGVDEIGVYTDLMFHDADDKNQVQYNFRIYSEVGPPEWNWPYEDQFTFNYNTRRG